MTENLEPDNVFHLPNKPIPQVAYNVFEHVRLAGIRDGLLLGFSEDGGLLIMTDNISKERALYLLELAKLNIFGVQRS